MVEKLNANDYSTEMTGIKYKVAHQQTNKEEWNISEIAQKKRLIKIIKKLVDTLEKDIASASEKKKVKVPAKQKITAKKNVRSSYSSEMKQLPERMVAKSESSF
ncbi:hypothetical protein [Legionella brunensis]|uniref:Uncharacterized protein n=1 Tax=Legionella brunensis TaxID=29422 RepID=A0A0W0SP42_9GAMM|nr:hypothetical protein [Legionella brunensis]KTC85009.1 hypothetical protein Lbru_1224 [Legionella brunensis]